MFGFGRKKSAPVLDFIVEYEDGRVFTSEDGTWDEVSRESKIAKLTIGGEVLEGYERYAFSWEAEARAQIGRSGALSKVETTGVVVAVIGAAVTGDTAMIVRVPRDVRAPRIRQGFPSSRLAFADHVWRQGAAPLTPTLVTT